jgi:hypothetical protein
MARNRMSLLKIVQRTLDSMNHDNVNSISDTIESRQIAEEARTVYYELMDREDWAHLVKLIPLQALPGLDYPNYMKIPEDVVRIDEIKYECTTSTDTRRQFRTIKYLEPNEFLDMIYLRDSSVSTTRTVIDFNGTPLFITNNQPPEYWTTFDDEHIIFDAYDAAVSDTLLEAKSLCLAKQIPPWTHDDAFIPDMPDQMFSTFLAEVTAAAFTYWKQGQSIKDEQRAARGISRLRKDARKISATWSKANYGKPRAQYYPRSEDGVRGSIRDSLSRY